MTLGKPVFPRLPGGPDPAEPVPRTPVSGFDLTAYASLSAELAARREPRAAVLSRLGLTEPRWLSVEQTWMLRLATALLQEDLTLGADYDAAYAAAQAALCRTPLPALETYARLVARLETGAPVAAVLDEASLDPPDLAHHQRTWTARLAADPALFAAFRALVEEAKADGSEAGSTNG